jgi:putative membrane protein
MITRSGPNLRLMVRYVARQAALLFLFDIAVVVGYVYLGEHWLSLPHLPLSIFGAALGVLLAFRNNSSYARWWEARTLWGRIVNYSRCLARQAIAFISAREESGEQEQVQDVQRRIVYYQIAYVNALRCQLRGQEPWPELQPFLPKGEIESLRGQKNVAAEIQRRMALLLQKSLRRGWLDALQLSLLDNSLTELANAQGGCERIKNTPLPRQYDYFPMLFVSVYCLGLPLNMVANLGWLTPLGSSLVGFVFLALDEIGRDLEFPFHNSVHDVPLTSICRTIEINLRQYLGETELPASIEPVRGVLW